MEEKKRKGSIRWHLIIIILSCFVLPIMLVIGIMNYVLSLNINNQVIQTVTTAVSSEVNNCIKRIDDAVSSSRKASYDDEVEAAYDLYVDTMDKTGLYGDVMTYLDREHKKNNMFLTTILYFMDDTERFYYTYNDTDGFGSYASVLKYKANAHLRAKEISKTLGTNIYIGEIEGSIYMIRNLVNIDYDPYAVIIMELDREVVFGGLKNGEWANAVTVWVNEARITLAGDPVTYEQEQRVFNRGEYDDITEIYGTKTISCGDFSYFISADKNLLIDNLNNFSDVVMALILLMVPLILVLMWFFYRNITRPIDNLVIAARKVEQGTWGVQVNEEAQNNEFEYLNVAFNSMSARLKRQFDTTFGEELALRDAKIMALQCQINPHFLNNTLEIINWEARLSDNVKISKMIEALSVMLDAAMDRRKKPLVHLYEELMYVDSYLYIISERFGKRLTVEKDIDRSLLDYEVPLLILQPILENAVKHGIEQQQKGIIIIRAYREGKHLILEIENDGIMTADDEQRIENILSNKIDKKKQQQSSLGIFNVNQRIKMIYGEDCGLTIKMNTNKHAVARIIVNIS